MNRDRASICGHCRRITAAALLLCAPVAVPSLGGELTVAGIIESTSGGFVFPDGTLQTTAGNAYAQIVVVAGSGGHFTSIQAALDSILDAASDRRYLVWVAPGVYHETVTLKPFVDLQGAGQLLTTITSPGAPALDTGTVICSDDAEVRDLTIENSGGDAWSVAVFCSGASPLLQDVTATVAWSSGPSTLLAIWNEASSSPTLRRVTVTSSVDSAAPITVIGVKNDSSEPTIDDVTITLVNGINCEGLTNVNLAPTLRRVRIDISGCYAAFGISNINSSPEIELVDVDVSATTTAIAVQNRFASSPTIRRSSLMASGATDSYGISNDGVSGTYTIVLEQSEIFGDTASVLGDSEFTVQVVLSQLGGGAVMPNGGTVNCRAVWDESYVASAATCP